MRSEERGLFEISYLAAGIFCNAKCHLSAFPSPVFQQGRDEGQPVHWRTVQATEAATGYLKESHSPDGCTPSQPASFWLVPCKRVLLLVSSLSGLPGWMLLLSEGVCLLGPARLKAETGEPSHLRSCLVITAFLHDGNAESLLSVIQMSHDPLLQIPQAEGDQ